jgi:hypothetical protein
VSVAVGNVPRPLRRAPLALLGDRRCQMSFGERAALEGVLAQLWPHISVEIGSAEGGSLQRVACYSDVVHWFDLQAPDADVTAPAHVIGHAGDSHEQLPRWLADAEPVDFVLIDGDHSTDGVYSDLRDVLFSDACRRTVVLLHDTANPDVRAGVSRCLASPRIVYHDLDFVPGYVFAEGPFADQPWGGLGIVLTGDQALEGYGRSPAQNLYRRSRTNG